MHFVQFPQAHDILYILHKYNAIIPSVFRLDIQAHSCYTIINPQDRQESGVEVIKMKNNRLHIHIPYPMTDTDGGYWQDVEIEFYDPAEVRKEGRICKYSVADLYLQNLIK